MRAVVLFLLAYCSGAAWAEPGIDLRVLTYNIKGLPAFIAEGYDERRFGEIGRILAGRRAKGEAPDIVLLQESFVDRTRDLREIANYPYMAKGPGAARLLSVDSGLYILSRHPIVEEKQRAFGEGVCEDWDCYANKGVQFARIALPGSAITLEVFNTHMQASRAFDTVRARQVKILSEFVRENHRAGNPVLFGGDFNFRPQLEEESYKSFLLETRFVNAGEYCARHRCGGEKEKGFWSAIVDHQFITAPSALRFLPLAVARSFAGPVNGMQLSDHLGLEMTYRLSDSTARNPPAGRTPASLRAVELMGTQQH